MAQSAAHRLVVLGGTGFLGMQDKSIHPSIEASGPLISPCFNRIARLQGRCLARMERGLNQVHPGRCSHRIVSSNAEGFLLR